MADATLRERFERVLALPLGTIRATMAQPGPPPVERATAITGLRLILALEGRKREIFATGDALAEWTMRAGDVLVARADTWLIPRFTTAHRHFGVTLDGETVHLGWRRGLGTDDHQRPLASEAELSLPAPPRSALRQVADALAEVAVHRDPVIASHLVQAFLRLLRAAALEAPSQPSGSQQAWRQALSFIADHAHRPLGRSEVAAWLGISENYLSRLSRLRGGASFVGLVTRVRLTRAASTLRALDVPIAQVARDSGFSDSGYFIRRFRRAFGQTPREYRRAQRSGRR